MSRAREADTTFMVVKRGEETCIALPQPITDHLPFLFGHGTLNIERERVVVSRVGRQISSLRDARRVYSDRRWGVDQGSKDDEFNAFLMIASVDAIPSLFRPEPARRLVELRDNQVTDAHSIALPVDWNSLKFSDSVGAAYRAGMDRLIQLTQNSEPHLVDALKATLPASDSDASARMKEVFESILVSLSYADFERGVNSIDLTNSGDHRFTPGMEVEFSIRMPLLATDMATLLGLVASEFLHAVASVGRLDASFGALEIIAGRAVFRPDDALSDRIDQSIESVFAGD